MEGDPPKRESLLEDVEDLDDLELLRRARSGDERPIETLIERYRNFARSKARTYFLSGADKEDVVQEGMIGLYKAIRDYDPDQETPFRAFAELCVSRQILTAIKTANRNKHQPLNRSMSLDAPIHGPEGERPAADTVEARNVADPAELVISAQEIEALRETMRVNLTRLEGDVLSLYMAGKSYEQIAAALGNHVKSIDNALQRIKRKLQKHLDERDAMVS